MNRLQTFILITLVSAGLCGLVALFINAGLPILLLSLVAIPLGIILLNYQRLLYALVLMTMFSGIYIPGLPEGFSVQTLFSIFYLVVCLLNFAITRKMPDKISIHGWILVLLIQIFLVIVLNGSGFRFLGSSDWGGLRYIQIILALLLMQQARRIVYSHNEWKKIMIGTMAFSLVPFAAELVYLFSQGRIYGQYYFVRFDVGTAIAHMSEGTGGQLIRLQSGNRAGGLLILFGLLLYLTLPRQRWISVCAFTGGFLLVGFSGHRSGFIDILTMTTFTLIIAEGRWSWKWKLYAVGFLGILALILVYVFTPVLPFSFQRMFSFLPGIRVDPEVFADASFSAEWRMQLWAETWNMIKNSPKTFWIGQGFTYPSAEFEALGYGSPGEYTYWWAYITKVYHQGILSLIVGTGIVGLFLFAGMTVSAGLYHLRHTRSRWTDNALRQAHLLLSTYLLLQTVKYFLFFGEFYYSLPILAYWFLLVEGLVATEKHSTAQDVQAKISPNFGAVFKPPRRSLATSAYLPR